MSSVAIGLKCSRSMIGIRIGDNVNDKEHIIRALERGIYALSKLTNDCYNITNGELNYNDFRDNRTTDIKEAIQYINDITKERDQLKYDITDYQYLLETCRKEKKVLLDKYNHERGQYAYDTINGDIWLCRP